MKILPNELLSEIALQIGYSQFSKNKQFLLVSTPFTFFLKKHLIAIKTNIEQQVK